MCGSNAINNKVVKMFENCQPIYTRTKIIDLCKNSPLSEINLHKPVFVGSCDSFCIYHIVCDADICVMPLVVVKGFFLF
jgi:hypothetical protein